MEDHVSEKHRGSSGKKLPQCIKTYTAACAGLNCGAYKIALRCIWRGGNTPKITSSECSLPASESE